MEVQVFQLLPEKCLQTKTHRVVHK